MVEWAGNPKRRLELNTFLLPKIYEVKTLQQYKEEKAKQYEQARWQQWGGRTPC